MVKGSAGATVFDRIRPLCLRHEMNEMNLFRSVQIHHRLYPNKCSVSPCSQYFEKRMASSIRRKAQPTHLMYEVKSHRTALHHHDACPPSPISANLPYSIHLHWPRQTTKTQFHFPRMEARAVTSTSLLRTTLKVDSGCPVIGVMGHAPRGLAPCTPP